MTQDEAKYVELDLSKIVKEIVGRTGDSFSVRANGCGELSLINVWSNHKVRLEIDYDYIFHGSFDIYVLVQPHMEEKVRKQVADACRQIQENTH